MRIIYVDMGEEDVVPHESYEEQKEKVLSYIVDRAFQSDIQIVSVKVVKILYILVV